MHKLGGRAKRKGEADFQLSRGPNAQDLIPGPQDHDLSGRQMINRLLTEPSRTPHLVKLAHEIILECLEFSFAQSFENF